MVRIITIIATKVPSRGSDRRGREQSRPVEVYVFDTAWKLLQVKTVSYGTVSDATGATVGSVIERTLICHDTDPDSVTSKLDAIASELK